MNIATDPISKLAPPPPIFGNSIEDTITADNADSFEDILQKQFSIRNESALQSPSGLYGIPTGLDVQALGREYAESVESIKPVQNIDMQGLSAQNDGFVKNEVNMSATIPDLDINQEQDKHSQLFKFAKKHAANFYNKCAGNVVVSLDEFVSDTLKLS